MNSIFLFFFILWIHGIETYGFKITSFSTSFYQKPILPKLSNKGYILNKDNHKYIGSRLYFSTKLSEESEIQWKDAIESLTATEISTEASNKKNWKDLLLSRDSDRNAIVLIAGFEKFNSKLYNLASQEISKSCPDIPVYVFTDTDINDRPDEVAYALHRAKVLLCSLIFDYTTIKWVKERIKPIPYRFCFESALELMSETQVDSFNMMTSNTGKAAGPPAPVKAILKQFGSNKEEDRMVGYLKLLKIGPKLLKFVPLGSNLGGIKTWITVYSYWTESGLENILSMLKTIINDCGLRSTIVNTSNTLSNESTSFLSVNGLKEYPSVGIFHPMLAEVGISLTSPKEYLSWYIQKHPWVKEDTPRVEQGYIGNMINLMESNGIIPIPIYINGVEGHTVVRDLFTSVSEQISVKQGRSDTTLSSECVYVDAVVNTIGFPLVGGPAGSMEGGRSIDAAKEILQSKNIPYIVAAPLLIQDMDSWQRSGVQGLQTVVLYSLPELDGAIETMVLGGLVGDKIVVIPERVRKLCYRLKAWIALRKEKNENRKIAMLVYGFPPNVGSIGTAALLNVGQSLSNLFQRLQVEGFNISNVINYDGDTLLSALRYLYNDITMIKSKDTISKYLKENILVNGSFEVMSEEVSYRDLKQWLGKECTVKMEKQWGDLESYSGIGTIRSTLPSTHFQTVFKIMGLKFGNILLGVQPILGIEGDPMRLLFERDLTPHPQYAAFYQYLNRVYQPHVLLHFGMHGTVEWLPGSPLGSTAESWPDILLGTVPNIYLYACNNPSESILAKRRGYATIVSHNVPPYSRSGLYKELISLRELISDYRQTSMPNAINPSSSDEVDVATASAAAATTNAMKDGSSTDVLEESKNAILLITNLVNKLGLWTDCPFLTHVSEEDKLKYIESILNSDHPSSSSLTSFINEFRIYIDKLWVYLSELENRLFSEGLHILGKKYSSNELLSYLDAVYSPPNQTYDNLTSTTSRMLSSIALSTYHKRKGLQLIDDMYSTLHFSSSSSQSISENNGSDEIYSNQSFENLYSNQLISRFQMFELIDYIRLRIQSYFGDKIASDKLFDILLSELLKLTNAENSKHSSTADSSTTMTTTATATTMTKQIKELIMLAQALEQNPNDEIKSLVRALQGEYVLPAPGGDVIRDGIAVLPTGRNIHALDPYRIPSPVALSRGKEAAELIVKSHYNIYGKYPETVSVNLWGLDTIKTKGESIGIVLGLVGAEPVREATGRIVAFELIPLERLHRPRIDVLGSLSGIFRDALSNVCDLLDDLFCTAAQADEPVTMNYIKLHSQSMSLQGIDRSYSRLFSNPPGDFGSMVNEQIGSGEWEDSKDLGNTWINRNSFSYGKSSEKGVKRGDVLQSLLNSTDRIIQQIDSVEYGLTDIQEYFANTGALKKAAENVKKDGSKVGVSVIEAFDKNIRPKELESVLRMEYRTKLLNPKWSAAMLKQGSGGAYEISGRMTSLIGWAGTTGFQDQWVFDGAAERYVLDEQVAKQLRDQNPEAFRNIVKRMMEANGRGFWKPSDRTLEKLEELYADVEDKIEGV